MTFSFAVDVKYFDFKDYEGAQIFEPWAIDVPTLLRAALTVGRQSYFDVMRFGDWSFLELLWRFAILAANTKFEQKSATKPLRLYPSDAFKALDGSEKGAVSYFLGLTFAKIVAERVCDVAWPMHLDVYSKPDHPYHSPAHAVTMFEDRKGRPDLIGLSLAGTWAVLEAKGRVGYSNATLREDAKNQTRKIRTIRGHDPDWRVASVSQFLDSGLKLDVIDPLEALPNAAPLDFSLNRYLRQVYRPIINLLSHDAAIESTLEGVQFRLRHIPELDLSVGLTSSVYYALRKRRETSSGFLIYDDADNLFELVKNGLSNVPSFSDPEFRLGRPPLSIGPDGVLLQLGQSWDPDTRTQLRPPLRAPSLELERPDFVTTASSELAVQDDAEFRWSYDEPLADGYIYSREVTKLFE